MISVRGLRKSYGDLEAVRGIDLEVAPGEIFAFLGPNGAGKTTTVEILEGYRERSAGEVDVLGQDPGRPTRAWRERDRDRPPGLPADPAADRARGARALRRLLPGAARRRRDDRAGRARGEGRRADLDALGRPAAPARRRPGADRRSRAALPRRADDRLRPLGAPPGLGGDRRPARARQDGLPHHPLHGRGAGAGRPGGDHRRRADRRRGRARRDLGGRDGDAGRDQLPPAERGSRRPTCRRRSRSLASVDGAAVSLASDGPRAATCAS